jgi:hypothetical protein
VTYLPYVLAIRTAFLIALVSQCSLCAFVVCGQEDKSDKPQDQFLYAPLPPKSMDAWEVLPMDRLEGNIEEFDEKVIRFNDGEKVRELASDRVAAVYPVWRTDEAIKAHQLYTERRYRPAIAQLKAAVTSKIPVWQQRLLIAELVDCVAALGVTHEAGRLFLESLAPYQPPAKLYATLPMNWTSEEGDAPTRAAAAKWLTSESEVAQLLGASWLLLGAEGATAQAKMAQLQKSKLAPIAALAVTQQWRLTPPSATVEKLQAWLDFRDRLLEPLQIGPTEFLAERLSRTGQIDLAIGQWSRIASLHAERYHRAAAALKAAQSQLQQQGRTEESKRLQAWIEQLQAVQ